LSKNSQTSGNTRTGNGSINRQVEIHQRCLAAILHLCAQTPATIHGHHIAMDSFIRQSLHEQEFASDK
jgi:hypothetical protein